MKIIMSDAMPVLDMFHRSIIDDSRKTNDNSRVIRMTNVSDAPSCGIILMTQSVSFIIIMFL
jgi:hypothetical protein